MVAFILLIIIISFEALSKGWMTLVLAPSLLVLLPVELILKHFAMKRQDVMLARLYWAHLVSTALAYTLVVGFGDTNEVLLFGFYKTVYTAPLVTISELASRIFALAAVVTALSVIIRLIITRP